MNLIPFSINNRLVNKYFNLLSSFGDVYLSGGFVRDSILGLDPSDIDFIFIGDLNTLINNFPNIKYTKVSLEHNILFFVENRVKIDIKVFPKNTSLEDICYDKDFSVNFLFYKENFIYSLFNAYEDLNNFLLKDPFASDIRYSEHPILIPRFLKMYAKDNFTYDKTTFSFFKKHFNSLSECSEQKLQDIGLEVICSNNFLTKIHPIFIELSLFSHNVKNLDTFKKNNNTSGKFLYIYISYLLNFCNEQDLSNFFSLFHINNNHLIKAINFFSIINDFKENKDISSFSPKTLNLLFFYFSSFEKDESLLLFLQNKKR